MHSPDFRCLIESTPDIVTVLGPEGRILYDSPAVVQVLGYAQGELVGRNAFELVHPDDFAPAFQLLLATVARPGRSAALTLRFRDREGAWRVLETSGRCVCDERGERRVVVSSRDASDRVRSTEQLAAERTGLEVLAREQASALEEMQVEMMERLARTAECRDDDTGQHARRVGEMAARLAAMLGLAAGAAHLLRRAAPLHDLGKIGIRDSILLKPGPLSGEESAVMQTHTILGARLLADGSSPFVRAAEQIALCHHECWDGTGYPARLRDEEIPLFARIVSISDFYDALTHDRPYRTAVPHHQVLSMVRAQSGKRFEPRVVEAFLELMADGEK